MGYSRSDKAVKRVQYLLDEMRESDKDIEWLVNDPQDAAYKIYDGIKFAIRSGKPEYEKYTMLLNKFRIRVIGDNIVKAELKPPPVVTPSGHIIRVDSPDALEIISAAIEYKKPRMLFPDIVLDDDNQTILNMWCRNNDYTFLNNTPIELVKNV